MIVTPRFQREGDYPPPAAPPEDFEALRTMPLSALTEIGMRRWGRREDANGVESGPMLWLFPGEWYEKIPSGFEIVGIFFETYRFELGQTDNDIRFGMLPFGILREDDIA